MMIGKSHFKIITPKSLREGSYVVSQSIPGHFRSSGTSGMGHGQFFEGQLGTHDTNRFGRWNETEHGQFLRTVKDTRYIFDFRMGRFPRDALEDPENQ